MAAPVPPLPTPPYRPGELIQVSATVGAVAIALAAIVLQADNDLTDTERFAAVLFMLSGATAVAGGGYAMVEMLAEVRAWSLGLSRLPDPISHRNAVGWTTASLFLLLPPLALLFVQAIE